MQKAMNTEAMNTLVVTLSQQNKAREGHNLSWELSTE